MHIISVCQGGLSPLSGPFKRKALVPLGTTSGVSPVTRQKDRPSLGCCITGSSSQPLAFGSFLWPLLWMLEVYPRQAVITLCSGAIATLGTRVPHAPPATPLLLSRLGTQVDCGRRTTSWFGCLLDVATGRSTPPIFCSSLQGCGVCFLHHLLFSAWGFSQNSETTPEILFDILFHPG